MDALLLNLQIKVMFSITRTWKQLISIIKFQNHIMSQRNTTYDYLFYKITGFQTYNICMLQAKENQTININ